MNRLTTVFTPAPSSFLLLFISFFLSLSVSLSGSLSLLSLYLITSYCLSPSTSRPIYLYVSLSFCISFFLPVSAHVSISVCVPLFLVHFPLFAAHLLYTYMSLYIFPCRLPL